MFGKLSEFLLPTPDYRPELKGYGPVEVFFGFSFIGNGVLGWMKKAQKFARRFETHGLRVHAKAQRTEDPKA